MTFSTADICDGNVDNARPLQPGLTSYGTSRFSGPVETVRVARDNTLVRETLSTPGNGRVLVVDGGGLVVALVGDKLASIGIANGWAGVVVNGYVRDTAVLATLSFGVMVLGTHPARSFEKHPAEVSIQLDSFLGVKIEPGNWIYADADGVIVSDNDLAD